MTTRTWIICCIAALPLIAACTGGDRSGSRWGLAVDGGERADVQPAPDLEGADPDTADASPPDDTEGVTSTAGVQYGRYLGGINRYLIQQSAADGSYCASILFSRYQDELPDLDAESPFDKGTAVATTGECPACPFDRTSGESLEVASVDGEIRQFGEDWRPAELSVDVRLRLAESAEGVPGTIRIQQDEVTVSRECQ